MTATSITPADLQAHPEGFLTSDDIRLIFKLSSTKLWLWLTHGYFPQPDIVLGPKNRYWRRSKIEAWIAAREAETEAGAA